MTALVLESAANVSATTSAGMPWPVLLALKVSSAAVSTVQMKMSDMIRILQLNGSPLLPCVYYTRSESNVNPSDRVFESFLSPAVQVSAATGAGACVSHAPQALEEAMLADIIHQVVPYSLAGA